MPGPARTAATPAQILIGKAVPYGAVLLAQQTAVIAYGVLVLGLPVVRLDLLLLAVVTWAGTLLCAGAALATVVRSHSELGVVTDLGGLFLTVLGGTMAPLTLMPAWLQPLAPASPGYWALTALRSAVAGDSAGVVRAVGVLTAMAVLLATTAAWRLASGWGRGRLL